MNSPANQSFSVDDIRKLREEADLRYKGMTETEIAKDIHERAKEARRIMAELETSERQLKQG